MRHATALAALLLAAAPGAALAEAPPDLVRRMIEAAFSAGDPGAISGVIAAAKRVAPQSVAEIDAMKADYERRTAPPPIPPMSERVEPWKAAIELGGTRTTGATDTLGLYGSFKATRTVRAWSHEFSARVDYQRDSGATTVDHELAYYEPRRELVPGLYGYGLALYERDPPLGFGARYVAGAGLGLKRDPSKVLSFTLEAGPSFRHTEYREFGERNLMAARGKLTARWRLTPTLALTEESTVFFESDNTSVSSTTALEAQLFGPLKARLSYNVEYESDAPGRSRSFGTVSRATLVYSR